MVVKKSVVKKSLMDYVMTGCEIKEVRQMAIDWQFELTSLHLKSGS